MLATIPPQTFCYDQTKIRKWTDGAINLKLKKTIVLLHRRKPIARDEWYQIMVVRLVKLSKLISW